MTPDEDVTLEFHCHVPTHEQLGMRGTLIIGKGGKKAPALSATEAAAAKRLFEGVGVIVAVEPRKSRLVLTHEEIKGFMAPDGGNELPGYSCETAAGTQTGR